MTLTEQQAKMWVALWAHNYSLPQPPRVNGQYWEHPEYGFTEVPDYHDGGVALWDWLAAIQQRATPAVEYFGGRRAWVCVLYDNVKQSRIITTRADRPEPAVIAALDKWCET